MYGHRVAIIGLGTAMAASAILACGTVFTGAIAEPPPVEVAETIELAPGVFDFPLPGEYLRDGRVVAAPRHRVRFDTPLRIMRYQVTAAAYHECVAAGACQPADARPAHSAGTVATGVNYKDAQAYAAWYSRATGQRWQLPTDSEWARAAGERFAGELFDGPADDPDNPAVAWIRRYREEAARSREIDPLPKDRGFYGPNANGVEDVSGNVWEWTSTCYERVTLGADGVVTHRTENCGVRIAEGRHRAYMSHFIRDGKSGGCAVGTAPDNLSFRLVRDDAGSWLSRILRIFHGRNGING